MAKQDTGTLRDISPDQIQPNPENPRIIFRSEEMASLMSSIQRHGILVPLTVFQDGRAFTLIDGERRWRCAKKLNLKTVPVLVQRKPTELDNLLMMFNIHALREQWDYFTIANKLPRIISLFESKNGREPQEAELSEATGLSRGTIRRCKFLLELPEHYKEVLVSELQLPKTQQKLSEDFFIEMERALKTVRIRLPDLIDDLDGARDTLIHKYKENSIKNVNDFRKLRKIATSVDALGVSRRKAEAALRQVFDSDNNVGITDIFEESFESQYDKSRAIREADFLIDFLEGISPSPKFSQLEGELAIRLKRLRKIIDDLVGG